MVVVYHGILEYASCVAVSKVHELERHLVLVLVDGLRCKQQMEKTDVSGGVLLRGGGRGSHVCACLVVLCAVVIEKC